MPRLSSALVLFALAATSLACRTGPPSAPAGGEVQPTVAGCPPPRFASLEEGRRAFTRSSDSLTATLEDASWLRFEGDPATVEAKHRAYFDYGYTTFQVELRSEGFTQPTTEVFLLEDSAGRRLEGRPISYASPPTLVDDRFFSTFSLSFPHVISRDLQWIRLVRAFDGATVQWTFASRPGAVPEAGGP